MVGGGHDDAELVGQLGALQAGAVQAEIGGPHRGPEIVALETQQQLEHLRIAGGVDAAEVGARPGAERGPFIVDEKAAVAHGRLFGERLVSLGQRDRVPAAGPDMVPVHERRDADALGQVEQAVDRAALVAARNDQRAADAGQRVFDEGEEVDLPFPRARRPARSCRFVPAHPARRCGQRCHRARRSRPHRRARRRPGGSR